ncbi:MAG: ABC transporter permease [Gemmatimonadota bacterium]
MSRTISGMPRDAAEIGRDQDREIEFHLAMRIEELVRAGEPRETARVRAQQEFGDLASARELLTRADRNNDRAQRRRAWTADWSFDFKYALRSLIRSPGFTLVAVLTLAFGMGATTSIFSIVNGYLLRPLPFPASDRLVVLNDVQPNYGNAPASYAEFTDWRASARTFEFVAAVTRRSRNFVGSEYPERVRVALVSQDYFKLIAPRVLVGRVFTQDEHKEGAPPGIVVAESFWRARLGGSRQVVGSIVNLDGTSYPVIGVISDFPDFAAGDPTVGWLALEPNPPYRDRGTHYLTVWARPRSGITPAMASQELVQVSKRLQQEHEIDHSIGITPVRSLLVGDTRAMLLAMMGIVAFVLMIAAVNVANLLLSRAERRQHEFAIRAALGAGRMRLVRQLIVEGLVLSTIGGAAGLLIGALAAPALLAALPAGMPRPAIDLDARVFGLAAITVIGAALLFGLAPVLVEVRSNLSALLKSSRGAATWTAASKLTRNGLVVVELALSLIMLVGAGLLIRVPQIKGMAAASSLPLSGSGQNGDFHIEGTPVESVRQQPVAEKRLISPSYLSTLGIRLVSGRAFTDQDRLGSQRVVLINETMARRMWPGQNPIGKQLNSLSPEGVWEEVVGVVSDVRSDGLDRAVPLEVLHPYAQHGGTGRTLILRSQTGLDILPLVRAEVAALDPQLPVFNVVELPELVARTFAGRRLLLILATGFAILALLLAGIGTAGVIAYGVARRTREIGVRLALGSPPSKVVSMIIREGMTLAGIGVVIGSVGALSLAGALQTQLFEIPAHDPLSYGVAIVTLLTSAALATWLPARKATRVDPLIAMHAE